MHCSNQTLFHGISSKGSNNSSSCCGCCGGLNRKPNLKAHAKVDFCVDVGWVGTLEQPKTAVNNYLFTYLALIYLELDAK